jgi:hypothetical protein
VNIRTVAASALAVALGLILSAPASAQTGGPADPQPSANTKPSSSGGDYQGDFDAGVNLVNRVRNRGVNTTYKAGWHAGASYRIIHVLSILAEASGDYKKQSTYTANIYAFSGGVRFESMGKDERVKPFAQLMMGTAMDNGTGIGTKNHYPVVTPGGGLDLGLAKHLAARLRLDFPLYATFGDVHKGARLAIGVSIPVGESRK